jgi:hypothetical protein
MKGRGRRARREGGRTREKAVVALTGEEVTAPTKEEAACWSGRRLSHTRTRRGGGLASNRKEERETEEQGRPGLPPLWWILAIEASSLSSYLANPNNTEGGEARKAGRGRRKLWAQGRRKECLELVDLGSEHHLLVCKAVELAELHLDVRLLSLEPQHHSHCLAGVADRGEALLLDIGSYNTTQGRGRAPVPGGAVMAGRGPHYGHRPTMRRLLSVPLRCGLSNAVAGDP